MPLPTDPLLASQWHLINATGLDLNVEGVWNPIMGQAYTGAGVVVAVAGDAFETNHNDFVNYAATLDYDFRDSDDDPFGLATEGRGTALMGLIGADASSTNGVGVAFDATLIGYRTLTDVTVDSLIWVGNVEGAIGAAIADADVLNFTYGLGSSTAAQFNFSVDPTRQAFLTSAINDAVDNGRTGAGLILVQGAGSTADPSSGDTNYNTNSFGMTNDTRVIVVGAVDADGFASSTSNHGASILVSGFGGTTTALTTTDRLFSDGLSGNDFNTNYTDTYAGAAMVSGVVALMLEANPLLGWRDVQSILAYSAVHTGTLIGDVPDVAGVYENGEWQFNGAANWNAGGLHFSQSYGFGLVDALAAVRLAETWSLGGAAAQVSGNETVITQDMLATPFSIDNSSTALIHTFTQAITIERVAVTLDFSTTWLADMTIILRGPDGTEIELISQNGSSLNFDGIWTFEAQGFRGMSSLGEWQVLVADTAITDPLVVDDVTLTFYGSSTVNDRYIFTDEYSDYGAYNRIATVADTNGGIDVVNLATVTSGATVYLDGRTGRIDGLRTRFTGIENAIGGDGNDNIIGSSGANDLWGGRGHDTLTGAAGHDELFGDAGEDFLSGGNNNDSLYGGDGNDVLFGDRAGETLTTSRDLLDGGAGNDDMYGGIGNDTFIAGTGEDYFDGGDGTGDVVDYSATAGAILLDLTFASTAVGEASGDFYVGIENVIATNFDDEIFGDAFANSLTGLDGVDSLYGNDGADSLYGGNENDVLIGGAGADLLDGGAGNADFASYGFALAGVSASLTAPATNAGEALGDTYIGIENLSGSGFADTLTGNAVANIIFGFGGNDRLDGQGGDDTLDGGSSNDTLIGGAGADSLNGGFELGDIASYVTALTGVAASLEAPIGNSGDALGDIYTAIEGLEGSNFADTLTGDAFDNQIYGLNGDDVIIARDGADYGYGGNGNDVFFLIHDFGVDTLDGGADNDIVDYSAAFFGVQIDLNNIYTNLGFANDFYIDIEGVIGTIFNDALIGFAGNDSLYGGGENDALYGSAGADLLHGGAGNLDFASYGFSNTAVLADLMSPAGNTGDAAGDIFVEIEGLAGTYYNDTLRGDAQNNQLYGSEGDDLIDGRGGDDTLSGDGDNDTLIGGAGADELIGGLGFVVASYETATARVFVSLTNPATNTGDAAGDIFTDINGLTGSSFNDSLTGDALGNALLGGDGRDTLNGLDGTDTLRGGEGDDSLGGGLGGDVLDGGNGIDWAIYLNAVAGVFVNLATPGANTGEAAGDTYISIENVQGSNLSDEIIGTTGANTLWGLTGNDTLRGGSGADRLNGGVGNDFLRGGLGNDTLNGGSGADQFIFNTALGATEVDVIEDFNVAGDRLVLDNVIFTAFANGAMPAGSLVIGTAATTVNHRLIYNSLNGQLFYDADGVGGAASQVLFATLTTGLALTDSSFLVI